MTALSMYKMVSSNIGRTKSPPKMSDPTSTLVTLDTPS